MLVSVVVPVYNRERDVVDLVRRLRVQVGVPFEVFFCG